MTTFNKTELCWIRDAIENDIARMELMLTESSDQLLLPQLITLRIDNLRSTLVKLNTIIASDAKRIGVC